MALPTTNITIRLPKVDACDPTPDPKVLFGPSFSGADTSQEVVLEPGDRAFVEFFDLDALDTVVVHKVMRHSGLSYSREVTDMEMSSSTPSRFLVEPGRYRFTTSVANPQDVIGQICLVPCCCEGT